MTLGQVVTAVVTIGVLLCASCAGRRGVARRLAQPALDVDLVTRAAPVGATPYVPPSTPTTPERSGLTERYPAQWYPHTAERQWNAVVLHHSACDRGSAATFDLAHRARGWDELGYHFVIGNGSETPDGYIEVGSRWGKQKHGAHCKTPDNRFNELGVGICLVGNFELAPPSRPQMRSLEKLLRYIGDRYDIDAGRVFGHREVPDTATLCPGKFFPLGKVRYSMTHRDDFTATSIR